MSHERERDRTDHQTDDVQIEWIAARLRAAVPVTPDFDQRVMAAVRTEKRSVRHRMTFATANRWWGGAVLAIAVTLAVLLVQGRSGTPASLGAHATVGSTTALGASDSASTHNVRFEYVTASAEPVHAITIVGSFNGWDTTMTPLRKVGPNRWATDIPLPPGRYTYQFVINGSRWVPDPGAPRDAGSDFGSSNSVVTVPQGGMI